MTTEDELARIKKKVAKRKKQNKRFFYGLLCMIIGILLGALFIAVPASAAHDYYEVRPTIDSNPIHQADYKIEQQYGYIKVILRCGYNTLSPSFEITNDDAKITKTFSIEPDGSFKSEFITGNYTVYLPDGNGGQPEPAQHITVRAQQTSYVVFLGHAISQPDMPKVTAKPTVQPTPTPSCHWHDGYWKRVCIPKPHGHGQICTWIYILGYWHCGGCN